MPAHKHFHYKGKKSTVSLILKFCLLFFREDRGHWKKVSVLGVFGFLFLTRKLKKKKKKKTQTIKKMPIGSYASIITLNVNELNAPTKRYRLIEWIQEQDPYICCYSRPSSDLETHTDWK